MPPTPNNFIINPDQVNIQAPKVQEQIAGATFVKEGEVSMDGWSVNFSTTLVLISIV